MLNPLLSTSSPPLLALTRNVLFEILRNLMNLDFLHLKRKTIIDTILIIRRVFETFVVVFLPKNPSIRLQRRIKSTIQRCPSCLLPTGITAFEEVILLDYMISIL